MKKSSIVIAVLAVLVVVLAIGWAMSGSKDKQSQTTPAVSDTSHTDRIPPDSLRH